MPSCAIDLQQRYLDAAIAKKIRKTCMPSCAIDLRMPSCAIDLRMPSCAIDLRQRLFRCSQSKKNLSVKLAKTFKILSVKLAEIGRKNIWSVNIGVHLFTHIYTIIYDLYS